LVALVPDETKVVAVDFGQFARSHSLRATRSFVNKSKGLSTAQLREAERLLRRAAAILVAAKTREAGVVLDVAAALSSEADVGAVKARLSAVRGERPAPEW
jgi:hypothetical protein